MTKEEQLFQEYLLGDPSISYWKTKIVVALIAIAVGLWYAYSYGVI